jgi:hypothetical protein
MGLIREGESPSLTRAKIAVQSRSIYTKQAGRQRSSSRFRRNYGRRLQRIPLLSAEFNNMQKLSDLCLTIRKQGCVHLTGNFRHQFS